MTMSEIRIGPMFEQCPNCAEMSDGYGEIDHSPECTYEDEQEAKMRATHIALGREVLDAIASGDAEALGRLLEALPYGR